MSRLIYNVKVGRIRGVNKGKSRDTFLTRAKSSFLSSTADKATCLRPCSCSLVFGPQPEISNNFNSVSSLYNPTWDPRPQMRSNTHTHTPPATPIHQTMVDSLLRLYSLSPYNPISEMCCVIPVHGRRSVGTGRQRTRLTRLLVQR